MAKNLINLAKSSKSVTTLKSKESTKKTTVNKPVEKKLTPEEQRNLKAKETVEKLLEDSPIVTLEKKEELLEIDEEPQQPKGVDWLEEQVTLLSEKNDALTAELALAKGDYQKLFEEHQQIRNGFGVSDNSDVKAKVFELFDELQTNHLRMGTDPQTGVGNFRIYCPGFLNRMLAFFPFLNEVKRY